MIDDPRALAARLIAASPLSMSLEDALKQKRERRRALLTPPAKPEPDFSAPQPLPIIDAPHQFASGFWEKRSSPHQAAAKPKSAAQRPAKPSRGSHPLRLIRGGKDGDK